MQFTNWQATPQVYANKFSDVKIMANQSVQIRKSTWQDFCNIKYEVDYPSKNCLEMITNKLNYSPVMLMSMEFKCLVNAIIYIILTVEHGGGFTYMNQCIAKFEIFLRAGSCSGNHFCWRCTLKTKKARNLWIHFLSLFPTNNSKAQTIPKKKEKEKSPIIWSRSSRNGIQAINPILK